MYHDRFLHVWLGQYVPEYKTLELTTTAVVEDVVDPNADARLKVPALLYQLHHLCDVLAASKKARPGAMLNELASSSFGVSENPRASVHGSS